MPTRSAGAAAANGQVRDGVQVDHLVSGEHAADWLGVNKCEPLRTVFGPRRPAR